MFAVIVAGTFRIGLFAFRVEVVRFQILFDEQAKRRRGKQIYGAIVAVALVRAPLDRGAALRSFFKRADQRIVLSM